MKKNQDINSDITKPPTSIYELINKIENLYDDLTSHKEIALYPHRAEDESVTVADMVDLIFTSPPYFDKEKYDQGVAQSYKMYKEFDSWMNNFLYKMIALRLPNLKKGGYLIINVSDIYTRKKHYQICNGMNDFIASQGLDYCGAIGLRMPKRPKSMSSKQEGVYGEPIFIWKK
jgi:DNA modification methylase